MSDKENKTSTSSTGDPKVTEPGRRHFLEKVTGVVAGAGVCAAAWPFISSMNPTKDVLSNSTSEVELGGISVGETKTVEWQGKPVFILHRTPEQIENSRNEESTHTKDPQTDESRVKKPEWLIVVGICTHLGCVPLRKEKGWVCPCHGSVYDNSGRIVSGPAPKNLILPPYKFLSDNKIIIGKTEEQS